MFSYVLTALLMVSLLLNPLNSPLAAAMPGQAPETYRSETITIPLTRDITNPLGISDPQAITVHNGVKYLLDSATGTLLTIKEGKFSYQVLNKNIRAGYIALDPDGNIHAFRNLLPLDTPRQVDVYQGSKQIASYPVPLNDQNKLKISAPDGTELEIYPQTSQAIPRPGGYLITYANGQRWFLDNETLEFRRYPDLVWDSKPGLVSFILSGYPLTLKTTGRATAFQYVGEDDLGYNYYSFVDFVDPDNQQLIVIKAKGDKFLFADVTGLADRRQNTHLTVDRVTGKLYALARFKEKNIGTVTLIGTDMFLSEYKGFNPKKPKWFNEGFTNPYIQLDIAAKTVHALEKILPQHPQFREVDRMDVWHRSLDFVNFTWTLKSSNRSGQSGSVVGFLPRWFSSHPNNQPVRGVPYTWGGSDTLAVFQNNLDKGFQAGNVETVGAYKGGTTGVDCSGLVWVTYGYPSRPEGGTVLISSPRYWTRIHNKDLVFMDMVRTPGHVVLFISLDPYDPDLFYTIEATPIHGNDTTMFWYRRFSDGYHGLRYNGLLIPQAVWNTKPEACPGGSLQVVHRERISYPVTTANGKTATRTISREKVQCSVCLRQWLR